MEEPKLKFNLLEWTTIIYALLTFLTYSFTDTYYSQWGIEIYSFLDSSEIWLSFLKNVHIVVIMLVLSFTGFMMSIYLHFIKDSFNDNNQIITKTLRFLGIKQVILTIVLLVAVYFVNKNINQFIYWNVLLFLTFGLKSVYLTIPEILNRFGKTINNYHTIAILLIYILAVNLICAQYKYYNIRDKFIKTSFSFNYESTTYKSNDTLLYIGATSKYIFLRNTKDSTNLIFDKSNIKNLSITEKHKNN